MGRRLRHTNRYANVVGVDFALPVVRDRLPGSVRIRSARTEGGRGASTAPVRGRPLAESLALIKGLCASEPDITHDRIAERLGVSTRRVRQILAQI
ncbi:MAG: sigma factor-like helix-turn-helix DNA-binding protein [Micromonosporaceae bacterium]